MAIGIGWMLPPVTWSWTRDWPGRVARTTAGIASKASTTNLIELRMTGIDDPFVRSPQNSVVG